MTTDMYAVCANGRVRRHRTRGEALRAIRKTKGECELHLIAHGLTQKVWCYEDGKKTCSFEDMG